MRHECLKCNHNEVCRFQEKFEELKARLREEVRTEQTPFSIEAFCDHFDAVILKAQDLDMGKGTSVTPIPDKWAVDEVGDIGLSTGASYLDKRDEDEQKEGDQ